MKALYLELLLNNTRKMVLHYINKFILLLLLFNPIIIKSQNEHFDTFISKFTQDSAFQLERISFPLTYISWDYEDDKEIIIFVERKEYKFDRLYYSLQEKEDAYPVFYDNFDCTFRDTGEMVFRWRGFTDTDRRYYFKRVEREWFLVKILDYDPIE